MRVAGMRREFLEGDDAVGRVERIPPLRTFPKTIDADCFNRVRLALMRIERPLRIEISGANGAACVLDDQAWVYGTAFSDLPMMAWMGFETRGRTLHEPVPCELRLFHIHAGVLMGPALEAIERAVGERLLAATRSKP